jgi:hypothetical protein
MDRDWFWAMGSLWDKKSTDRCRVTIADTVICSGGEPQQWMFTSKVSDAPMLWRSGPLSRTKRDRMVWSKKWAKTK